MNSGRGIVAAFLTALCGLSLAAVGLGTQWPDWGWPALAGGLAALFPVLLKLIGRNTGVLPCLPLSPVDRDQQRITQVALPSLWPDYNVLFSATIRWHRTMPEPAEAVDPGGLAVRAILARAQQLTSQREPTRISFVQHELNGELSRMRPDPSGYLDAMATDVTLTLADSDQDRLDRLATVRKNKEVWEHERKFEQNKREYLGKDVLADTASAVVWWLHRNDDQVDKTVRDIGLLAQLSAAANDEDIPERYRNLVNPPEPVAVESGAGPEGEVDDETEARDAPAPDVGGGLRDMPAAEIVDALLQRMRFAEGDPQRPLIAVRLARIMQAHGRPETALDILERFGTLDDPAFDGILGITDTGDFIRNDELGDDDDAGDSPPPAP